MIVNRTYVSLRSHRRKDHEKRTYNGRDMNKTRFPIEEYLITLTLKLESCKPTEQGYKHVENLITSLTQLERIESELK